MVGVLLFMEDFPGTEIGGQKERGNDGDGGEWGGRWNLSDCPHASSHFQKGPFAAFVLLCLNKFPSDDEKWDHK